MRNNYFSPILYLFILVLFAILCGVALISNILWLLLVSAIFICLIFCYLFLFYRGLIRAVGSFIDLIRFAEFNISHCNYAQKKLPRHLSDAINNAVDCFNERMKIYKETFEFHKQVLNNIEFGLIVAKKDKDGQIVYMNKCAENMLSVSRAQTINHMKMIFPEYPHILSKIVPEEVKILRYDTPDLKTDLIVTMTCAEILGKEYKIFSFKDMQLVIDDIESQAWQRLLKVLAYEMKNAIIPITSIAEIFSSQQVDYDHDLLLRSLQVVNRRSKDLDELMSTYLDFVTPYKAKKHLYRLDNCIENVVGKLQKENIRCSYHVFPKNMRAYIDIDLIEKMIENLVLNAWQATNNREKPNVISITVRYDLYMRPLINVEDNGIGMPSELINHIFIPFFTTKKNHVGIGLSICRKIVSVHSGRITVSSQINRGTCFTVRL